MNTKKKRKPSFVAKTIDGELTTSRVKYVQSYVDVSEKLKSILNLGCIGFDPDFLMYDKDNIHNTVDIPVWLARRIIALAEGKRQ